MNYKIKRRELLAAGAALALASALPDGALAQDAPLKKSQMKLGLISYNVAENWDLPTVLKNCAAAGIQGFEARTGHAHGIEPSLPAARRPEIRKQFADAGVTLWGLGTTCEFQSPDPATVQKNIDECKAFVTLAQDLGAHGVKVRPNGLPKGIPVDKTLAQIATALRACGEFGAAHGIEIWLEVHGPETQQPEHIKRIMELCAQPNVGACWNSNNTDIAHGSVRAAFDLLWPHIRSCHINDLWGNYPYRELFQLFNAHGYDRFTMCEVATPVAADSGIPFLKCYRGLWQELQRA